MQIEGLVTTIIPVHNRPEMIREAVASVLAQTYRRIEVVIVDDGSTDNTGGVVDQLVETGGGVVRATHIENGGPGVARETGRQMARGEFIQYLDSDDLLMSEKFELQVAALRARPECGAAYGVTRRIRDGVDLVEPWKRTAESIPTMLPSFLESRWWDTSTPLYRAALLDRAGPWSSLRNEEDWEYDCRVGALGVRLAYVGQVVSVTRFHSGPMLSAGHGIGEVGKMRDRARAHALILKHAETAGIPVDAPEMRHFARELFLLSRQAGALGLTDESIMLFDLSRKASGTERSRGLDFLVYRALATLTGWTSAGRIARALDRLRV